MRKLSRSLAVVLCLVLQVPVSVFAQASITGRKDVANALDDQIGL